MSREATVSATQMVARSLRISAATHLLVASVSAGIAVNAAVAMQFLNLGGEAVLLAVVFVTVAAAASTVSLDVFSRSSQVVSNLRSIGANRNSVSSAVVLSLVGYGAAGAAIGTMTGGLLGAALGGEGTVGEALLIQMVGVVLTACAAMAVGVFYGARRSWSS